MMPGAPSSAQGPTQSGSRAAGQGQGHAPGLGLGLLALPPGVSQAQASLAGWAHSPSGSVRSGGPAAINDSDHGLLAHQPLVRRGGSTAHGGAGVMCLPTFNVAARQRVWRPCLYLVCPCPSLPSRVCFGLTLGAACPPLICSARSPLV